MTISLRIRATSNLTVPRRRFHVPDVRGLLCREQPFTRTFVYRADRHLAPPCLPQYDSRGCL